MNCGCVKVARMCEIVRERCSDAPPEIQRYALLEWFCHRGHLTAKTRKQRDEYRLRRAGTYHDEFLASYEWRRLRMEVIKERGARCECCGATPADGKTVINVDHVKPRKTHPELALVKTNLQVLCHVCNHGKGNWDQTDWRPESRREEPAEPTLEVPTTAAVPVVVPAIVDPFVVTESWLMQHRTAKGGWTRKQLALVGVPWPLPKHWKKNLVGRVVEKALAVGFETIAEESRKEANALYEQFRPCFMPPTKAFLVKAGVVALPRDMQPRLIRRVK